ncbi:MAG: site-specific DNA-methyltransferase [Alphaproteobacteria bacterium]|nr:site-specific DNA-methyltransferase [Alphaproteobacteria bacterium]
MQELDIKKLDGKSLDVAETDKERLKTVFPQCFVEGKLDIDKLLSLCGEYIDNDFEKYKFEWKGKSDCLRIAGKRSTGTLRPCPEESVDFENTNNLYIEGDNLEVLKLLQTAYYRKVKMIYIDPPYNTGNDFVYEDDFKDPMAKYKEITSQTTKSNPETMGRYHTNWLNMMYPRLRLAANLLRDDGVIFISIDDNEVDNLKKICNEVFGEENFVINISWRRTDNQPNIGNVARVKEYILVYAKEIKSLSLNKLPLTEKAINEYRYEDKKGKFRRAIMLDKTRGRHTYEIKTPSGKILTGPWMLKEEEFNKLVEADGVYWTSGGEEQPYGKIYLHESKGQIPNDFWGIEFGTNQRGSLEVEKLFEQRLFDFPKPVSLIKNIINLGSSDNDIVLDFFSGSATTAHAVMQLNAEDGCKRQFIMVQLPELTDEKSEAFKGGYKNICEIGKERIRRAGAKIKEQNADVDVGFKVLKLDTSNLNKWDDTPLASTETADLFARMDGMIESIKKGRSELDVVYEVMLKLGIPATYKVFENNINGRKVYSIGDDGLILVCLDGSNGGITPEDVTAMCEFSPAKIVAAEEAFKDDVALSNAFYISKDSGVEIMLL